MEKTDNQDYIYLEKNVVKNSTINAETVHIGDKIYYAFERQKIKNTIVFLRIEKSVEGQYSAFLQVGYQGEGSVPFGEEVLAMPLNISEGFFEKLHDFELFRKSWQHEIWMRGENESSNFSSKSKQEIELGVEIFSIFFPKESSNREVFIFFLNLLQKRKIESLVLIISSPDSDILNVPFSMMRTPNGSLPISLNFDNFLIAYSLEENFESFNYGGDNPLAPPLRILFITSLPEDLPDEQKFIDLEMEQEWLMKALGDLPSKKLVAVEFLEIGSLNEIERALQEGEHQIVQISGHGLQFEEPKVGVLCLEDDEGNSSYVSGEELANLLKKFSSIKLVMLSACESARAEQYGVAGALLRLGIPSIIGMRYPISDKKASLFTSIFYNHLCNGKSLSKALSYARYAIYEKEEEERKQSEFKSAEWFTPFLYLNQNVEHLVDYRLPQSKAEYFFQRFRPFIPSGVINAKLERTSAKLVARGFVGRRKQLAQLNNILSKREKKAICIHGLGGLGKTSLAVRFIDNFYNKGFNIIEWEGEVSEYDIISKISKSLPVEQQEQLQIILLNEKLTTSEKLNFILNDFLKDGKFILFFDNFEDNQIVEPNKEKTQNGDNEIEISSDPLKEVLLELCQKVSELEGNVFLLFTSRYKIKELPLYYLDLAKMSFPDTYKLINRSSGLINLTLTQKYDLHKRLGGHPRALELFGSLIRNSDENVWEDIEKEFYTVEDFLITQDLLLELLWQKLSELERSTLGTASIMRDLTNQSVLSQITGIPKGQLSNILQKLNTFSLVYLEDVWFFVHKLTSQFVLKNFSRETVKEWHRSAYDEFFEGKESLQTIIEARWHLIKAEEYNKAAEVSFILKNNLSSLGHHSYAIQILEELIDFPLEKKHVNLLRNELGVLLQHVGDYKKANDLFRSAFSSLSFKDDPKLNPSLILNIGNNYYETGEFTKAIQYFQDLLEWSEQFDDAHYKMVACISLGDAYSESGHVEDSFKYLDRAIVEENSKYHAAKLFHIGKNFYRLGQLQKAFDTLNESLTISKHLNDERGMVGSASNIGVMLREAGQIEEAFKYRNYTYELNLKLNRKGEIAKDIIEFGILYFMQGNLEKAERMFLDALELTLPIGKKQSTILAYRELGIIEYERRNFTKALEFFNLSMELGKEIGNIPGVALDYYEMGLTFNQMGEIEKAFTHFDNAIDYNSRVKNIAGIGKCIMGKAMVFLKIEKFEDSLESFCNALAILVKMQEHRFARICINNISKISDLIPKSKFDEITIRLGIIKADNGSISFLEIDDK